MTLTFTKYHGLGNDFVLIDSPVTLDPTAIQDICDRHHGVGADGILILAPHPSADAQMIVFNADGSRPEMCGNGLRCAAFHVASKFHHHPTSATVTIATDVGPKDCFVQLNPPSDEALVQVDLGPVSTPTHKKVTCLGQPFDLITTAVGNPHAVLLQPTVPFDDYAAALSTHPAFPNGANISFVQPQADHLLIKVWERGAGPTLACGTAACAVAAVAVHEHLAAHDTPIFVQLPGGRLEITISTNNHAIMTGPAKRVFDGSLSCPCYETPILQAER